MAKSKESNLSKKPPWPGIIWPLSFTPAMRLSLLLTLLLPVPLLLLMGLGAGLGMFLGSLNVFIRDVGQIVPILMGLAF